MNYIGSKLRLLDFLETSIKQIVGNDTCTLCDVFAGTGTVGTHFKKLGYKVIANDLQYYSYVMNRHFIVNNDFLEYKGLENDLPQLITTSIELKSKIVCNHLNTLSLIEGFIYDNYASGGTINQEYSRMYFSDENAKICDTVRIKLNEWKTTNKLTDNEFYYLLACLIDSTDKKANTASV